MKQLLMQAGLTVAQADTYLLLLNEGPLTPPQVANRLKLTRSNAYKVLEQLMVLQLAHRHDQRKKLVYEADDPHALMDILAVERNKVLALERAVKQSVSALSQAYSRQASPLEVKTVRGATKLKRLYEEQAELRQPIHFIKSRADIPALGYETMAYVRTLPAQSGTQRFGITPDSVEAPNNPELDKRSNLTRTWIDESAYTASVEWSVSGDEVTIFVFEKDGAAVRIKNAAIAESLRQIWQLWDSAIRKDPEYCSLPRKAQRSA